MISRKTVLILGAGASEPYGFPLGRQLLNRICALLGPEHHKNAHHKVLHDLEHAPSEIEEFWNELRHSDWGSVDEFLEKNHRKYIEIGKHAIASALIPFEDHNCLFPPRAPTNNWYNQLAEALDVESEEVTDNQLAVLTFNYDRSLEEYLRTVIRTRRHCSLSEAEEIRQSIQIIHLYGDLGKLESTTRDEQKYSPDLETARVKAAAESMKILHESEDRTPEFDQAEELLEQAQCIYFLGFGYHPTNVRRLRVFNSEWDEERKKRQIVKGTILGIDDQKWGTIVGKVFHGNIGGRQHRGDCSSFLKTSARLT